jgi:DNA-binding response OmpR family regulator
MSSPGSGADSRSPRELMRRTFQGDSREADRTHLSTPERGGSIDGARPRNPSLTKESAGAVPLPHAISAVTAGTDRAFRPSDAVTTMPTTPTMAIAPTMDPVLLPVADPWAPPRETTPGEAEGSTSRGIVPTTDAAAATPAAASLRILLVEDTPTDRELIERALRRDVRDGRQLTIQAVGEMAAALAEARRGEFSAILLDYVLARGTGLDVLQALRREGVATPVIMMTGAGDEKLAVAALKAGAADYLVKELGFERKLPLAIDRVLRDRDEAATTAGKRTERAAGSLLPDRADEAALLGRALCELEAFRRVSAELTGGGEIGRALEMVARAAGELTDAHAAALLVHAGAESVVVSTWGRTACTPGFKSPTPVVELDKGMRSVAHAGLRDGSTEIGRLWVGHSAAGRFDASVAERLEPIGALASLAIGRLRAVERLRQMTRRESVSRPAGASASAPSLTPRASTTAVQDEHGAPAPTPSTRNRLDVGRLTVPPLPDTITRLTGEDEDDIDLDTVAEVLSMDPGLSALVVRAAGSAFVGRAHAPRSPAEAVLVLGVAGVRNLALAQFTAALFKTWGTIEHLLWEQAVGAAVRMRLLVEKHKDGSADDAYLAGLLHNLGAIALNGADPEAYAAAVRGAIARGISIADAECAAFGVDGAALTGKLVARWGLPQSLTMIFDVRAGGPIGVARAWATVDSLRVNRSWLALLGDAPEPQWLHDAHAAAVAALPVDAACLSTIAEAAGEQTDFLRETLRKRGR